MSVRTKHRIKRKRKQKEKKQSMEASKVTLNQDMRNALNNPILDKKKKRELKIKRIKEYIMSKPNGTKMSMKDLMYEAGYDVDRQYAVGWVFVNNLIKKRIIIATDIPKSMKKTFVVPGTTIKEPDNPVESSNTPEDDAMVVSDVSEKKNYKLIEVVEAKAKQFAWENNSDSLREFIKFLK